MKQAFGWWFPSHEQHMLGWLAAQKPPVIFKERHLYQGKKQMAVLEHCPPIRRRVMIDVGAHIGLWAFMFSHYFERIEAFEPVEEHQACFIRNQPPYLMNLELHTCALGANKDKVKIVTTNGSSGDSKVHGPGEIPMERLDSFGFRNVDLIKIDCEGFEENVAIGALETIQAWKPVIVIEQKRDMAVRFGLERRGGVKFLQHLGYRVAQELSGDYIMVPK